LIRPVRIAVAGTGAWGRQHLDALAAIEGVEVTAIVSGTVEQAQRAAATYGVEHATADLDEVLGRPDVNGVILCTPTPLHAQQAIAVMHAGKHVQVEIPLADRWPDAQEVARIAGDTGVVCMVGHTRRFNPSHQFVHQRIRAGELSIQHLHAETYFLRRSNLNALGEPRDWTDHLLWHHAAHTVDLFRYQTGEPVRVANAVQGPPHPDLGIAMDLSIQLRSASGRICSLALSFNNDGPLGTTFRYIGDTATYVARYDDLWTGREEPVNLSTFDSGVVRQDREFVAAIRESRAPLSSVTDVLPAYEVLHRLDRQLGEGGPASGGRDPGPSACAPRADGARCRG
jgi:2-hydroxy-4-carboxymuconate semialdehyde hemiacetal dehydrogenase